MFKNIGPIQETNKDLRRLLNSETTGKQLLEKSEKGGGLNSRDRAYIVKRIVESELKKLDKLNSTIRKDVWMPWAHEISQVFNGEKPDVYYVPYKVVAGKVIQASGLIHNRLITHRRSLAPESCKRKGSSSSSESDSGHSSGQASNCGNKRVRPLPEGFKNTSSTENSSLDEQLTWLQSSSSPPEVVVEKWKATLDLRNKLLATLSFEEYFNTFPALGLPNGYKLVSDTEAFFLKLLLFTNLT